MRRLLPFVLLSLVALLAAGCPATTTTPPPVDMRAVHLAQVPAETEFVVQADLPRVLDPATIERWVGRLLRLEGITVDPACALALLGRAQVFTEAMLHVGGLDEEAMVLISGDLAAAEVAACTAQLLDGEAPTPDAEGVYAFNLGREVMQLADLAAGGVVLASPAAMSQARGPAPAAEASLAGAPAYQQLRALLAAGPVDLELFVTKPMDAGEFGFQGVGVALQRGTADRYEVVILAGDADGANALAMFVATLPLVIAGLEAQLGAAAEEELPLGGEALAEALAVVAAAREALTAARTTVEGDVVRVVLELDPARASPVQLMIVGGMVLFARSSSGPGGVEPPPPVERIEGGDYPVPGVSEPAVDQGQPPVE